MTKLRATPSQLRVRAFMLSLRLNAYERAAITAAAKRLNWNEQEILRAALFGSPMGLVAKGEAVPYINEMQ